MRSIILFSTVLVSALVVSVAAQGAFPARDQTAQESTGGIGLFFDGLRRRISEYAQTGGGVRNGGEIRPASQSDINSEIANLKAAIRGIEGLLSQLMGQIQQGPGQKMHMQTQEAGPKNPLGQWAIPATELIMHQPPRERFTKAGLMSTLDGLHYYENQGEVAEWVAGQLYDAMDKQTTELFNGVTIQELIDQNQIELKGCSMEAFKDRSRVYLKTMPQKVGETGVVYGVNVYALRLLRSAAEYCTSHQGEVVSQGINKAEWLRLLANASRQDKESVQGSGTRVDEEFVHHYFVSRLAALIEGSYDNAWDVMKSLGRRPERIQHSNGLVL